MAAKRLFLIHWNRAEAEDYAQAKRAAGWQVDLEAEDGARAAAAIKAHPPDVVVIYLTRMPSHGRQTAAHLAESKATRQIPIILVGGEGEALAKTQSVLPAATFTSPDELAEILKQYSSLK